MRIDLRSIAFACVCIAALGCRDERIITPDRSEPAAPASNAQGKPESPWPSNPLSPPAELNDDQPPRLSAGKDNEANASDTKDHVPIVPLPEAAPKKLTVNDLSNWPTTCEKYENQMVDIEGVIENIVMYLPGIEENPAFCVLLEPMPDEAHRLKVALGRMPCFVKDSNVWKRTSRGSSVTLRGFLTKGVAVPQMENCLLLESSGDGALEMTAAEFASAVKADPKSAAELYNDKTLVVRGRISRFVDSSINSEERELFGAFYVFMRLEGTNGHPCLVHSDFIGRREFECFDSGDLVTLIGQGVVDADTGSSPKAAIAWAYPLPQSTGR